jgi:ketosteroid isomerase-like protein
MTTRATIDGYFERLQQRAGWDAYLADDLVFTILTSPTKSLSGKQSYLQSTRNFYGSIKRVEVRELIVDGERACAFTHYLLQPANGAPAFESDVAELFTVRDGQIGSFTICFDTAPYPK